VRPASRSNGSGAAEIRRRHGGHSELIARLGRGLDSQLASAAPARARTGEEPAREVAASARPPGKASELARRPERKQPPPIPLSTAAGGARPAPRAEPGTGTTQRGPLDSSGRARANAGRVLSTWGGFREVRPAAGEPGRDRSHWGELRAAPEGLPAEQDAAWTAPCARSTPEAAAPAPRLSPAPFVHAITVLPSEGDEQAKTRIWRRPDSASTAALPAQRRPTTTKAVRPASVPVPHHAPDRSPGSRGARLLVERFRGPGNERIRTAALVIGVPLLGWLLTTAVVSMAGSSPAVRPLGGAQPEESRRTLQWQVPTSRSVSGQQPRVQTTDTGDFENQERMDPDAAPPLDGVPWAPVPAEGEPAQPRQQPAPAPVDGDANRQSGAWLRPVSVAWRDDSAAGVWSGADPGYGRFAGREGRRDGLAVAPGANLRVSRPVRAVWDDGLWWHPLAGPRRLPASAGQRFGAARSGREPGRCGAGHCGVDLPSVVGEPVHAARAGVVDRIVRSDRGRTGRYVRLVHGVHFASHYMHLDQVRPDLRTGMIVEAGQILGTVGRSGVRNSPTHLHFAVTVETSEVRRHLDPEPVLRRARVLGRPVTMRSHRGALETAVPVF
jgi:murein DD-endopeptidase MepM/ murein hydrolase activator NlpD